MDNIYLKGYIEHGENIYTFTYKEKLLTLISVKPDYNFLPDRETIVYFKGLTVDNCEVIFYIDNEITYHNGVYESIPKAVILARTNETEIFEEGFDSLSFSGGVINRFYSNERMIKMEKFDYNSSMNINEKFSFKSTEETISSEKVDLNNIKTTFELCVMNPGWKNDEGFVFNDFNSQLRIKYDERYGYEKNIENIFSIIDFFRFCCNRSEITVDNIYMERNDINGKKYYAAKVIVPCFKKENNIKRMINYNFIEEKLNNIFKVLEKSNYIYNILPKNDFDFSKISNKDYVSVFSCFESLYKNKKDIEVEIQSKDEENFLLVKEDVLNTLNGKIDIYAGKKKEYLRNIIHIVESYNLILVKKLKYLYEDYQFLLNILVNMKIEDIAEIGIYNFFDNAVKTRNNITHADVVELTEADIEAYYMIIRMNYIIILENAGLDIDKITSCVQYLSNINIL